MILRVYFGYCNGQWVTSTSWSPCSFASATLAKAVDKQKNNKKNFTGAKHVEPALSKLASEEMTGQ